MLNAYSHYQTLDALELKDPALKNKANRKKLDEDKIDLGIAPMSLENRERMEQYGVTDMT